METSSCNLGPEWHKPQAKPLYLEYLIQRCRDEILVMFTDYSYLTTEQKGLYTPQRLSDLLKFLEEHMEYTTGALVYSSRIGTTLYRILEDSLDTVDVEDTWYYQNSHTVDREIRRQECRQYCLLARAILADGCFVEQGLETDSAEPAGSTTTSPAVTPKRRFVTFRTRFENLVKKYKHIIAHAVAQTKDPLRYAVSTAIATRQVTLPKHEELTTKGRSRQIIDTMRATWDYLFQNPQALHLIGTKQTIDIYEEGREKEKREAEQREKEQREKEQREKEQREKEQREKEQQEREEREREEREKKEREREDFLCLVNYLGHNDPVKSLIAMAIAKKQIRVMTHGGDVSTSEWKRLTGASRLIRTMQMAEDYFARSTSRLALLKTRTIIFISEREYLKNLKPPADMVNASTQTKEVENEKPEQVSEEQQQVETNAEKEEDEVSPKTEEKKDNHDQELICETTTETSSDMAEPTPAHPEKVELAKLPTSFTFVPLLENPQMVVEKDSGMTEEKTRSDPEPEPKAELESPQVIRVEDIIPRRDVNSLPTPPVIASGTCNCSQCVASREIFEDTEPQTVEDMFDIVILGDESDNC